MHHLNVTIISSGQRADLTCGMSVLGGKVGPIIKQRSGLGGGRVPIIGRIGGGQTENSSVLHGLPGFLWLFGPSPAEYRDNMKLTSYWHSSVREKVIDL